MISRKDYDMIAKVFRRRLTPSNNNLNAYAQGRRDGMASIALDLGYELLEANPKFNIDKWVTATTKRDTN